MGNCRLIAKCELRPDGNRFKANARHTAAAVRPVECGGEIGTDEFHRANEFVTHPRNIALARRFIKLIHRDIQETANVMPKVMIAIRIDEKASYELLTLAARSEEHTSELQSL